MPELVSVIRWEDPPPPAKTVGGRRPGASKYDQLAAELRSQPGRWALVQDKPGLDGNLSHRIKRAGMDCFSPAGDFDAVSRRDGGRIQIYARYLGDQDGAS